MDSKRGQDRIGTSTAAPGAAPAAKPSSHSLASEENSERQAKGLIA